MNFQYFFGIDFCMPFWMPFFDFWSKMNPKMGRRNVYAGILLAPRTTPKTHPRRNLDFSWILEAVLVIFWRFWLPKSTNWDPTAAPKRSKNASATQPLFLVGFEIHFGYFFLSFSLPAYYSPPMSRKPADFSLPISLLQVAGVLGCGGVALRLQ